MHFEADVNDRRVCRRKIGAALQSILINRGNITTMFILRCSSVIPGFIFKLFLIPFVASVVFWSVELQVQCKHRLPVLVVPQQAALI